MDGPDPSTSPPSDHLPHPPLGPHVAGLISPASPPRLPLCPFSAAQFLFPATRRHPNRSHSLLSSSLPDPTCRRHSSLSPSIARPHPSAALFSLPLQCGPRLSSASSPFVSFLPRPPPPPFLASSLSSACTLPHVLPRTLLHLPISALTSPLPPLLVPTRPSPPATAGHLRRAIRTSPLPLLHYKYLPWLRPSLLHLPPPSSPLSREPSTPTPCTFAAAAATNFGEQSPSTRASFQPADAVITSTELARSSSASPPGPSAARPPPRRSTHAAFASSSSSVASAHR